MPHFCQSEKWPKFAVTVKFLRYTIQQYITTQIIVTASFKELSHLKTEEFSKRMMGNIKKSTTLYIKISVVCVYFSLFI